MPLGQGSGAGGPLLLPSPSCTAVDTDGSCSSKLNDREHHSAHWQLQQLCVVPGGKGRLPALPAWPGPARDNSPASRQPGSPLLLPQKSGGPVQHHDLTLPKARADFEAKGCMKLYEYACIQSVWSTIEL